MKIREILKKGIDGLSEYGVEEAREKAKRLLLYELGVSNEYMMMHLEEALPERQIELFEKDVQELIKGKPVQYITHSQWFYGLEFYVDENVLIPQPDTEVLVEEVISLLKSKEKEGKILDICTGSGAIAVTLAKFTNWEITASDISREALAIAQKNAKCHRVEMECIVSDLFEKIEGTFDVIVSNPPYIETGVIASLSQEVKNEPMLALDGGEDGLMFYRRLANEAGKYLVDGGILAVEIGYNQKKSVIEILEKAGFQEVYCKKDFGNQDRIVVGKWR